jgi:hypothetical protein
VMRHLATKHVEGSRTSAPRDETPAPAAAVAAPVEAVAPAPEAEPEPEPVAVAAAEPAEPNTPVDEEE